MDKELKERIMTFLDLHESKLGVVSTISEEGKPESAAVYYTFDQDLNFYFVTRDATHKYKNILKNTDAAFVIATEDPPQTLQIEGSASVYDEVEEQKHLFQELVELASAKYFSSPINQQTAGGLEFVKISPRWIRFGNFEVRKHEGMFQEVKL